MAGIISGAEEIRTPDLLSAIQALSQLSYRPGTYPGILSTVVVAVLILSAQSDSVKGPAFMGGEHSQVLTPAAEVRQGGLFSPQGYLA